MSFDRTIISLEFRLNTVYISPFFSSFLLKVFLVCKKLFYKSIKLPTKSSCKT